MEAYGCTGKKQIWYPICVLKASTWSEMRARCSRGFAGSWVDHLSWDYDWTCAPYFTRGTSFRCCR